MKSIMKKAIPFALGVVSLAYPQIGRADDEMRLTKLESQMRDVGTSNSRGTYGAKLADASPNIDGYGFYITADALLVQLFQENAQYGLSLTDGAVNASGLDGAGERDSLKSHFNWDWGFKVGLGYYAEHDFWQTGFELSYLRSIASSSHTADTGYMIRRSQPLYQTLSGGLDQEGVDYTAASDHWRVTFYNLDWRIGKDFFISKYVSLLPELGVKTTWFYQTRNLNFTNVTGAVTTVNKVSHRDQFEACGPKADLVAKLHMGRNFSVLGAVDVALMYAQNKTRYTDTGYGLDLAGDPTTVPYSDHQRVKHVSPYLGMTLGLAYDTNFNDDAFNFGMKLSYNTQFYGNANRMLSADYPGGRDIEMQGVDLSFEFSF